MECLLPNKDLLEKHSSELKNQKNCYNLSKLVYHKDFKDKLVFPLGIDNDNTKYYIDFCLKSGLLISGETGSSKSMFLHSIILSLLLKNTPSDLQFVLIDPRNVEFNSYCGIPHLYRKIVFDEHTSLNALNYIMDTIEKRRELFVLKNAKNINSYNLLNEEKLPQIILIIDEIIDILDQKKAKQFINKILSEGYKFGIHLILATSSYFKSYFDQKTIDMFNYILTFDLASEEQSYFIKIKSAHLLNIYGDALVKRQDNNIINVQTPYVSEHDIEEIVNFFKEK